MAGVAAPKLRGQPQRPAMPDPPPGRIAGLPVVAGWLDRRGLRLCGRAPGTDRQQHDEQDLDGWIAR